MAQDPEREERQSGEDQLLTTHALDMFTLWRSTTVNAEMEADMIRGVLESNDIPVMVVGASQYHFLGFEVKVPRGKVVEANELIAQAQQAGPEAAVEAEDESEKYRWGRPSSVVACRPCPVCTFLVDILQNI